MSFHIITFYEFKRFAEDQLPLMRASLRGAMREHSIRGTVILASEGFNATVCGTSADIVDFISLAERILDTRLEPKSSFHDACPFQKIDVKIKPEIVTLKKQVDIKLGVGTHVHPRDWNEIISDPSVVVLDTRNDYEFRNGTFKGAINPQTEKFSELPEFVEANLDPTEHSKVAMFCTGGIRCEKFAPYLKQIGFSEVFQLQGGILSYLEQTPADESMWEGECFVFDERVTVDRKLRKGIEPDHSLDPRARRSK